MTDKVKDVWKMLLGGAAILLLSVGTILWNVQWDIVKNVEARVTKVEDNKAEKEEVREIKEILRRMEDKIDAIPRRIRP